MKFFNRVGHVDIQKDYRWSLDGMKPVTSNAEIMHLNGLDFRFHVEKTIGAVKDKASVSILGLNRDSVSRFSTFIDEASSVMRRNRVRVYAGYEDEGEHLILDGDIIRAYPTVPPDNWLNMTIMANFYKNNYMMSMNMSYGGDWVNESVEYKRKYGYKISEIIDRFVKYANLKSCVYDINCNKQKLRDAMDMRVKNFDCTGTQYDIINELNLLGEFSLRIEDDMLVISDPVYRPNAIALSNQSLGYNGEYNLSDGTPMGGSSDTVNVIRVSADSGMIGIPQYKYPFCTMTMRMTSAIKIFDVVELDCTYNKEANGLYKIYGLTYDGHLRGEPWYVKITARNMKAPLTDQEKAQVESDAAEKAEKKDK